MAGGWIRFAGTMNGYGNVVRVDHGGEVLTVYAHLSELWVRTGDVVAGRAVIGLSGATGDAVAPHLHFELWRWARERETPLWLHFNGSEMSLAEITRRVGNDRFYFDLPTGVEYETVLDSVLAGLKWIAERIVTDP